MLKNQFDLRIKIIGYTKQKNKFNSAYIIKPKILWNYFLIKGKVENTLRNIKKLPKKISILRLDTDFYESTKIELEVLFPRLVKGGVLIIDDYGFWKGAKKAVDEYFSDYRQFFHYIDHSCRLLIKK